MSARHFLIVVAIVQGGLLAALIVLIILNRWFRLRRSTRLNPRRQAVDASMRRWAAGTTPLAGGPRRFGRPSLPPGVDCPVGLAPRPPGGTNGRGQRRNPRPAPTTYSAFSFEKK